jgi:hypothetical protein
MTLASKEHLARMRLLAMHAFVYEHLAPNHPGRRLSITQNNRQHRDRAPDGSQEAMDRINAAALKRLARQRKAVKHRG